MDISWVHPLLAVGGRIEDWDLEALAGGGLRRVVDVRSESQDDEAALQKYGIELLKLPTPDLGAMDQEMLWTGVAWVRKQLEAGERVLVHCEHGIGRSALLACCVLVSLGAAPQQALAQAKSARSRVSPSRDQLEALRRFSLAWCEAQGEAPRASTFEELARIAYGMRAA